jgi:hypothetical protein
MILLLLLALLSVRAFPIYSPLVVWIYATLPISGPRYFSDHVPSTSARKSPEIPVPFPGADSGKTHAIQEDIMILSGGHSIEQRGFRAG